MLVTPWSNNTLFLSSHFPFSVMSQVIDIMAEELDQYVEQGGPVLLLIWIRNCDQCRLFKPIFNQLPEYYPGVQFLRMNMFKSMENLRLAEKYEKETTPIIPVFCRGEHLGTFIGYYSMEDFREKLDKVLRENDCIG